MEIRRLVKIKYRNDAAQVNEHTIIPVEIFFGHPHSNDFTNSTVDTWIMFAVDITNVDSEGKGDKKFFRMHDILAWW